MAKITVWTKQHIEMAKELTEQGRYVAKKEIVRKNEESKLMIEAYDWLVKLHPDQKTRPKDADYPIWLSYKKDATMMNTPNYVILELEVDEDLITPLNVAKWSTVNNFAYLPIDKEDEKRHQELLSAYGVSDVKAYTSQFYPEIKREITDSWQRLFDKNIVYVNEYCYGLIWEIKKEWVKKIVQ